MQTISDTFAHGALARPRADLLGGRAPRVVLARGRDAAPEPAGGEPPHPAPRACARRAPARARRPPRVSHARRRAAAPARGPRPRRAGGGAPGDPAAARCGGRTRPARHRRHREHVSITRRPAPAVRAPSRARPGDRHRQLRGPRRRRRRQPARRGCAHAAGAWPPARERALPRRSPGRDRRARPRLAAARRAATRGPCRVAADPVRARRHHPPRDRRVVPARRRAAAGGHGTGQRGGNQAAGGGGARRVGHLRRRRPRRATRADADGARAGAAAGAPPGHRAPPRQAADAGARRGAGRARRRRQLMTDPAARRRSILWRTRFANLFGAVMAFVYFRFIDPVTSGPGVTWPEIAFFVVAFTALTTVSARFNTRWAVPMLTQPGSAEARRRALLFPWAMAGSTLSAWVVAGLVTAAIVFFSIENRWRRGLPGFFPAGDLSAVRGVPRLPVRTRLLVVFLLTSVGPLALLGIVAWRRSRLAAADPANAAAMLGEMLALIGFFIAVSLLAAIRLSWVVSDSVAAPLLGLTFAMARVERGDLGAHCPVVSNDEIGAATEGFNRMLDGLREREAIKETFGRYVTREVRDEILAGRVSVEGEQREVTVLFADLRDFTPWVESSEPRQVVRDLNAYFAEMEAAIRAHGGLVVQFIGDEIEAVFGAPVPAPDHPARAVRAALEMRARLATWNAGRARPLSHGIGVHTGSVLAGAIGSRERLSYALVGDTVNLASRIEGLTRQVGADILVSATTARGLDGGVALDPLPAVRVKGRSAEVEVFRVV